MERHRFGAESGVWIDGGVVWILVQHWGLAWSWVCFWRFGSFQRLLFQLPFAIICNGFTLVDSVTKGFVRA